MYSANKIPGTILSFISKFRPPTEYSASSEEKSGKLSRNYVHQISKVKMKNDWKFVTSHKQIRGFACWPSIRSR